MAFIELQSKNYFPVYAPVAKNIFKGFVSLKELDIRVDFLINGPVTLNH